MTATVGCQNFDASDGSQTIASPNEDYPGTSLTNSDDIVYNFSIGNYDYDLSVINETNINNIPNLGDVKIMVRMLNSLGIRTEYLFDNNVHILNNNAPLILEGKGNIKNSFIKNKMIVKNNISIINTEIFDGMDVYGNKTFNMKLSKVENNDVKIKENAKQLIKRGAIWEEMPINLMSLMPYW